MDIDDYTLRCPLCGATEITVSDRPQLNTDEPVLKHARCNTCGHSGIVGAFVVP